MNIRFYNCRVLSMGKTCEIIDGEVWTKGEVISYVGGKVDEIESKSFKREIDCRGNLIMPGFKDAHAHAPMTFLRSFADDLPLQEWLFDRVFPMEDKLTPDDVCTLTKLAIAEYLTAGITSSFEMYFFPEAIAQAAIDTGFRIVLCGAISGEKENIRKLSDLYDKFNAYNSLISYHLGFHAEYTASLDLLKEVGRLAKAKRAPVYTHNSETRREVEECIERHGMTPTALFDKLGIYNYGGGGFHCVHMSDNDMDIFAKRKLTAVTNPGSNTKLSSGIAPICEMQKRRINLAIGTDGPASNNCLDMFREMFLVTGLQKIITNDASACPADSVLKMATTGGADAMGLRECDCLAAGKKADLIMLDLNQPNMQPLNNIAKNIVYSGSKQNVKLTMINGRILYENGNFFIGEDVEDVYRKSNEIIGRMK